MFNPTRLKLARKRQKLTSKKLADLANTTPVTLSRIEKGLNEPAPETVSALSAALGYPIAYFYGDDLEELDTQAASFRSLSTMTARDRDAALAAGSIAFLICDWVDQRFNLPDFSFPSTEFSIDPQMAARQLRDEWGLGEKPISNMIKLLEAKGVRVLSLAEDTFSVDAFSCWKQNIPFVFLNTRKSSERSRFDAAHELGHLILHRDSGTHQDRSIERDADAFAASFLMPSADVVSKVQFINSLDTIIKAKKRWGVSTGALLYRLNKLGIVSDWQNRTLNIQLSKRGYRTSEPEPLDKETSSVWKSIFAQLWKDKITREHICQQLHIPKSELDGLVFGLLDGETNIPDRKPKPQLKLID